MAFERYLELYSGPIPTYFAGLPGSSHYDETRGTFWAVLIPEPAAGSPAAEYIAPVPASAPVNGDTRGTETLPNPAPAFTLLDACISRPKSPPYRFKVTAPSGYSFFLDPPSGSQDETEWHCVAIPPDLGIGIWVVEVQEWNAPIPQSIGGRNAQLNPDQLAWNAQFFHKQPLLKLRGREDEERSCPDLTDLVAVGCTPGLVQFTTDLSTVDGLVEIQWDFGDGTELVFTGTQLALGVSPTHEYSSDGTYIASVTVVRDAACSPVAQNETVLVSPCPTGVQCPTLISAQVDSGCAPGEVTLSAAVDVPGAIVELTWTFGDGSSATFSNADIQAGEGLQVTHDYAGEGPFNAVVTVIRGAGCSPLSDSASVDVESCPEPVSCSELLALEVVDGCAPGEVTFEATIDDPGSVVELNWDFDDGVQEAFSGAELASGTGLTVTHAYAQPGPFTATVSLVRAAGCAPLSRSESVDVPACVTCAEPRGLRVSGCAPGTVEFTVDIADPTELVQVRWVFGDGSERIVTAQEVAAGEGLAVQHEYTETGPFEASVIVTRPAGCDPPVRSVAVTVPSCECPTDAAIAVTRDGAPVPPGICVSPGWFEATAIVEPTAEVTWTLDGEFLSNGTSVGFDFDPAAIGNECGGASSTTVTMTATSADPECPDRVVSQTLTVCRNFQLSSCVPCWLLKLGILLFASLFALFIAITMCPEMLLLPTLPLPAQALAAWEAFAAVVVFLSPWLAILSAFIAVVLLYFWIRICDPDWCNDWLVLFWQFMVSVGVVFIYFGACPACVYLLVLGIPAFLIGAGAFFWWLVSCRPTVCKVFFEIGSLGLVTLVVGWLEIILGACIWAGGPIFMALWMTFLNVAGWVGTVIACLAAPPAGSGSD